MSLTFRSHYWDDPDARAEFIRFTREVHGLDLTAWFESGFGDDDYAPFSFFEDDRIVSHVCVYLLPMVVAGRECTVPQVSAVGTDSAYRRRGLNRELTNRAFDWCRDRAAEFSFLFADEDAFRFYAKCGFRRVHQHRYFAELPSRLAGGSSRRLDTDDENDRELLVSLARTRTGVSDEIGCLSVNLLMFHTLYKLSDCAYWLEEPAVVVFARPEEHVLRIFDIVGPAVPPLSEVLRRLPPFDVDRIELMFMPDKLADAKVTAKLDDGADGTHIGGVGFPFETRPFRFSYTAHA